MVEQEMAAEVAEDGTGGTDEQKRSRAYARAQRILRNKYRAEFDALLTQECAKEGITYVRRLTEKEKALEELKKIYDRYPDLRPR